jgi:hypothetical protein
MRKFQSDVNNIANHSHCKDNKMAAQRLKAVVSIFDGLMTSAPTKKS